MDIDTAPDSHASPLVIVSCLLAVVLLAVVGLRPQADQRVPVGRSTLAAVTNSDAALSTLAVSGGSLQPAFAADVNAYTLRVDGATTSVAITPTLSDPDSSLRVDTAATADGATTAIPLDPARRRVLLVVTAPDHTTARTIVLSIARPSRT